MRCIYLTVMIILISVSALMAQKPPLDRMKGPHKQSFEDKTPPSTVIKLYQRYVSPIDGDRCPMYPGCSSYMAEAVAKHGIVKGVMMGTDRLLRCGRKLQSYPWIIRGQKFYAYDPVEEK